MIYLISNFQAINAFDYTFPVCRPSLYYVPQFVLYFLDLFLFLTNGCHMIYSFQFFHVLIIETALPYLLFKKNEWYSFIHIHSIIHSFRAWDWRTHSFVNWRAIVNKSYLKVAETFSLLFFSHSTIPKLKINGLQENSVYWRTRPSSCIITIQWCHLKKSTYLYIGVILTKFLA